MNIKLDLLTISPVSRIIRIISSILASRMILLRYQYLISHQGALLQMVPQRLEKNIPEGLIGVIQYLGLKIDYVCARIPRNKLPSLPYFS